MRACVMCGATLLNNACPYGHMKITDMQPITVDIKIEIEKYVNTKTVQHPTGEHENLPDRRQAG